MLFYPYDVIGWKWYIKKIKYLFLFFLAYQYYTSHNKSNGGGKFGCNKSYEQNKSRDDALTN